MKTQRRGEAAAGRAAARVPDLSSFGHIVLAVVLASLLVVAPRTVRAEPSPVRAEIPIREVALSNGQRRYAVSIKVGSTEILTGLDSGSVGLRVLPGVLKETDVGRGGAKDVYSYDSGAQLTGVVAKGVVSIGPVSGQAALQLVQRVGCRADKPRCPAMVTPPEHYGIQGDGLADEGFKAILGVNMGGAEDIANPFKDLGVARWIIELPRPGEHADGRLILNPSEEEMAGYTSLPTYAPFASQRGSAHDGVQGCLADASAAHRICGVVVLDTGAPGIKVMAADQIAAPWSDGATANLVFADGAGRPHLAESFVIGRREHASHLSFAPPQHGAPPQIMAGLTPYFAYSILYDPGKRSLGFKPRPVLSYGPTPLAIR